MLFLFNLILLALVLFMALTVAATASAPHSADSGEVGFSKESQAATGVRAIPTQFINGASVSPKMPAVVAAGLQ